jgi:Carbohydrate-selective porin, OprB family/S-layer homology domain
MTHRFTVRRTIAAPLERAMASAQSQTIGKFYLLSAVLTGAALLNAIAAPVASAQATFAPIGTPSADSTNLEPEASPLAQVTSVSQLSDVKPTDWAFQALQSLVERYGCIAGYPDKTYRGNRALTRYEFAAGLNACLDRVNELIAASTANLAKKEDLATLQKLQEQFAKELAVLRGRVDALDGKVKTLEKQQFSTTTKLFGETVIAVAGVPVGKNVNKNTVLGYRTRLNLDSSFTGKDLLRTRLQASNLDAFSNTATFAPEGDLRFAGTSDGKVLIDALLYQFPLGEKTTITVEANAGAPDDFADTLNPYLDGDGGSGALTQFGTRSPLYYIVSGTGIGIKHEFSDKLALSLGYLVGAGANDPASKQGLFNGQHSAIAQLTFKPSDSLGLGLVYVNAYNQDFSAGGGVGSINANVGNAGSPFTSNSLGALASFKVSPQLLINGNIGYTNARLLKAPGFDSLGNAVNVKGNARVWNWSVGLAFPDLGSKGSLGGLIVGMEPRLTSVSGSLQSALSKDSATSLHVEGFYQYRLNDNVAITPGLVWLTNYDHTQGNGSTVIGAIRTTFTF